MSDLIPVPLYGDGAVLILACGHIPGWAASTPPDGFIFCYTCNAWCDTGTLIVRTP